MALLVKWCFVTLAVFGVHIQEHARAQLLGYFRKCVLPHEVRARMWERYDQFCTGGRKLEWRRRTGRCICKPGYYRDEETKNCFEAKRCGTCDSSKHEKFNACLSDCEMICGKRVIQQCNKPCKPGCECMRGYIRKYKKGPCVPVKSCPPKCPAYMKFVLKRERCPRVCNEAREDTCSDANEGPGCVCKKGFVLRAIFGTIRTRTWCIHESMCHFPDEEKKETRKDGSGKGVKDSRTGWGSGSGHDYGLGPKPTEGQNPSEDSTSKKTGGDLYLGSSGFPNFGDLDSAKGRGPKTSDDWSTGQAKVDDSHQSDDWFKKYDIFSGWKQDKMDASLSPTKVVDSWTPGAKGKSQADIGTKGGSSSKGKGSGIPGVGFASTDGLPDIVDEGVKGNPFGDWNADGGGDLAPSKVNDEWLPGNEGSHKGGSIKGGFRSQSKRGGIPERVSAVPDGLPDLGDGGYKGAPRVSATRYTVKHAGSTKGVASADGSSAVAKGIINAGVNLGKKIFSGLGSIASFGSLLDYSRPGLGKAEGSVGNIRENHDVSGKSLHGEGLISRSYASRDLISGARTKTIWRRRRREAMTASTVFGLEQRRTEDLKIPLKTLLDGDNKLEERGDPEGMVEAKSLYFNYLSHKNPVGSAPTEEQYVRDELNLIPKVRTFGRLSIISHHPAEL